MSLIFAHRGFSGCYPENTMIAFEKMVETGCVGTELDVQLTLDGELVIIHDERLERTTNGTGFVKDYTLAQLRELTADFKFAGQVSPQKIPTLREYLTFAKGAGVLTNIELKTSVFQYHGIEQKVLDLVTELDMLDRVWVSSFNHFTIERFRKLSPTTSCGLLINCWIVGIGDYARQLNATTVNAETEFLLEREIVDELHSCGIAAQAWTVNEPDKVRALIANGVDCIITNFPDMAVKVANEC